MGVWLGCFIMKRLWRLCMLAVILHALQGLPTSILYSIFGSRPSLSSNNAKSPHMLDTDRLQALDIMLSTLSKHKARGLSLQQRCVSIR